VQFLRRFVFMKYEVSLQQSNSLLCTPCLTQLIRVIYSLISHES